MLSALFLRHAKSSWKLEGLSDHERPLNQRGQDAARRVGQLLRDEGLVPDLIYSSDAERAKQTVALLVTTSGFAGVIVHRSGLYLAEPAQIISELATIHQPARRVLCVGHNPGMEELVSAIAGHDIAMPTAALAEVEFHADAWTAVSPRAAKLKRVWRARDLEG